jgi:hypothetical protein
MTDGSFTGKISGFHVLRVAVGESKPPEVRLRCFAIVSEPLPPPAGKEIEVVTMSSRCSWPFLWERR